MSGILSLHEKQDFVSQDPDSQDLFEVFFSIKKKSEKVEIETKSS